MNILTKFIATTAMTGGTLISLGLSSAPRPGNQILPILLVLLTMVVQRSAKTLVEYVLLSLALLTTYLMVILPLVLMVLLSALMFMVVRLE